VSRGRRSKKRLNSKTVFTLIWPGAEGAGPNLSWGSAVPRTAFPPTLLYRGRKSSVPFNKSGEREVGTQTLPPSLSTKDLKKKVSLLKVEGQELYQKNALIYLAWGQYSLRKKFVGPPRPLCGRGGPFEKSNNPKAPAAATPPRGHRAFCKPRIE